VGSGRRRNRFTTSPPLPGTFLSTPPCHIERHAQNWLVNSLVNSDKGDGLCATMMTVFIVRTLIQYVDQLYFHGRTANCKVFPNAFCPFVNAVQSVRHLATPTCGEALPGTLVVSDSQNDGLAWG
jgi:hypothetical protein